MIFKPDNFRADWYGWITNQGARAGIAAIIAGMAAFIYYGALGEYPYRLALGIALVIVYIAYEIRRGQDEFKPWDSAEDTLFWTYGVALALGSFKEVQRTMLTLEPQLGFFWMVLSVVAFHSVLGIGIRVFQACRR